jgi:hypothetical protein
MLALVGLASLGPGGCRKKDRVLTVTPYPKAKLAYRIGNCVYMDLNHAGEPDKAVCYGDPGDHMMVADYDGNGTSDLAVRRAGILLIDTLDDGAGHDTSMDLGWIGDASGMLVADFSGSADYRGRASVCVVRGDRCRIQGTPAAAAAADRRLIPGQEHFAGRWQAQGSARLGARNGRCLDLDYAGDERADRHICYEDLTTIDQVLVGDWNGDGNDDVILRRAGCVFVDMRLDGTHTETQCMVARHPSAEYFVGSWDGK